MFGLEHLLHDKCKYQVRSSTRCPSFLYSLRQSVVTEVSRNVPVLSSVIRTAVTNCLIQQMKSGIPQWNMEVRKRRSSSVGQAEVAEEADYADSSGREAEQPW